MEKASRKWYTLDTAFAYKKSRKNTKKRKNFCNPCVAICFNEKLLHLPGKSCRESQACNIVLGV
ncbi:MAG: hypothetical protein PHR69_11140, partial [Sphaerochaeta sp.]|nr:hypothetical protein [Sphaerochaeta sp.]